jgi:type I restriction enzyme S subunit
MKFLDYIQVNPTIKLEKDKQYPFVEMANADVFAREPKQIDIKKYSSGVKFQRGDTVIARIEPCLQNGKGFFVKNISEGFGSTEFLVFRPKDDKVTNEFLYYFMLTDYIRKSMINSMTGATGRQRVNKDIFKSLELSLPSIEKQKRIADILSAYDDLIENNQKQIKLLEEAAMRLYKEWFVKLRFPGYETTKIVDGVPEGWEKLYIEDVCQTVGGGTPSTKVPSYYNNGTIPWVTPTDITRNDCLILLDTEKKITEEGLARSSAKMLPSETILMTSRASVGFFGISEQEVCTNQGFISCIPNNKNLMMFLLLNLMSRKDEIRQKAGGATYLEINKSTFRKLIVIKPDDTLLNEFQSITYTILKRISALKKQSDLLKQARDKLLPKLMNGDIEV